VTDFDQCLCTLEFLDKMKPLQQILKEKMPTTRRGNVSSEHKFNTSLVVMGFGLLAPNDINKSSTKFSCKPFHSVIAKYRYMQGLIKVSSSRLGQGDLPVWQVTFHSHLPDGQRPSQVFCQLNMKTVTSKTDLSRASKI